MKKIFTITLLIFISIQFTACLGALIESTTEKNVTVEKGAIPPDFGKDNSTLLIITHSNKSSEKKTIDKIASKNYHGKYEVLTRKEFDNEQYNNLEKYRYILFMDEGVGGNITTRTTTGNLTTIDNSPTTTYRYSIVDRKENKDYKCPVNGTLYTKIIEGYMVNLEKQRISSQGK
jgi:hypothetical protein